MAVLPRGGSEDKIRCWINARENIHAHPLTGDEPVPSGGINWERAPYCNALIEKAVRQPGLEFLLRRPANLIRGVPQITASDEDDFFHKEVSTYTSKSCT